MNIGIVCILKVTEQIIKYLKDFKNIKPRELSGKKLAEKTLKPCSFLQVTAHRILKICITAGVTRWQLVKSKATEKIQGVRRVSPPQR